MTLEETKQNLNASKLVCPKCQIANLIAQYSMGSFWWWECEACTACSGLTRTPEQLKELINDAEDWEQCQQ